MSRDTNTGRLISLLRTKEASEAAELVGKALRKTVSGAGNTGAALARGAGLNENAGRALGLGALAYGGYSAAKSLDQKRQQALYNMGYYG